jgi:BolA protein
MHTRAARIHQALDAAFAPAEIMVVDDSASHAGHSGARPGGETHYTVAVVSPAFAGMGRLARSRAVHAVLAAEFGGGLHALSLRLAAPEEVVPKGGALPKG